MSAADHSAPQPNKMDNAQGDTDVDLPAVNDIAVNDNGKQGDQDPEYVVEKVVDHRGPKDGRTHYKLRWEGFKSKDDTWEEVTNLDCDEVIAAYEKNLADKKAKFDGTLPQSPPTRVLEKRSATSTPRPAVVASRKRSVTATTTTPRTPAAARGDSTKRAKITTSVGTPIRTPRSAGHLKNSSTRKRAATTNSAKKGKGAIMNNSAKNTPTAAGDKKKARVTTPKSANAKKFRVSSEKPTEALGFKLVDNELQVLLAFGPKKDNYPKNQQELVPIGVVQEMKSVDGMKVVFGKLAEACKQGLLAFNGNIKE